MLPLKSKQMPRIKILHFLHLKDQETVASIPRNAQMKLFRSTTYFIATELDLQHPKKIVPVASQLSPAERIIYVAKQSSDLHFSLK